ncbi:MAG: hypothetical protein K6G18_10345 [Treponema sp.]|nr:hypothetical protein [Treponema sp.]
MSEVVEVNPPFGRKIFFVNPSFKVQSRIIAALRVEEYEIYVVQKWRDVKNFLSKNPDSICMISVDGQMPLPSWIAMVDSFSKDKVLSTIICGFLTENAIKNASKVLDVVRLKAGYNTTSGDDDKIKQILRGIFDVHGAKGRRQHVRCSCFRENAYVYFTLTDAGGNPSMFQMKIVDISSATVAVEVPDMLRGRLRAGTSFQNVIIALNGRQINTGLKVFLLKNTEKQTEIAIFSYPSSMSNESKTQIRTFISMTLQKEMDRCINGMKEDKTDYAIEAQSFQLLHNAKAAGVKLDDDSSKASEAADKSDDAEAESGDAAEEGGKTAEEGSDSAESAEAGEEQAAEPASEAEPTSEAEAEAADGKAGEGD